MDQFNPGLSATFNINSILTLVVENTFSEKRAGGSDMYIVQCMPLQLEFECRLSRSIKEHLKRQCSTPSIHVLLHVAPVHIALTHLYLQTTQTFQNDVV